MTRKPCLLFLMLLLMAAQVPFTHTAATSVTITPANPVRGDLMKIDVTANPDENVDVQLSFTKTLNVASGRYQLEMDGVQVPPPPNNFSVKATGVTNLSVAVVIIIPITKSASASGGVATVSQGGVPAGNYDLRISGDAEPEVSSVSLLVTASKTITTDASGHYTYSYPTGSLPSGTVTASVGNIVKTLELTEPHPADATPPPSASGPGTADNTPSNQVEATPQPTTNWTIVATATLIAAVIVLAASLSALARRFFCGR